MSQLPPDAETSAVPHRHPVAVAEPPTQPKPRRVLRYTAITLAVLFLLALLTIAIARPVLRSFTRDNLPQLDGSQSVPGLAASVIVQRDAHGVPHIHAQSLDDLVFAQAFVTTSDRLFQMDALRRHAAGELAEIFGSALVPHDRLQRTLQIRAAADRALTVLPSDQLHLLEVYANGVNASIAQQSKHLPIEFRVLQYTPAPWTPRDSILVSLAMFEDLTNAYPTKLARESLAARLPANLIADLYPVGSWRDHPPATPVTDLTVPGPPIVEVPLDESQSANHVPDLPTPDSILATLQPLLRNPCLECTAGSNNWVVSGAHTASGKPLLSNDMHLSLTVPGIWYESDLEASQTLHVAGVTIPGLPLIVVGHNDHVAWGFTNFGADVQDVYVETLRGEGSNQEFLSTDGTTWQPTIHHAETIKVHHNVDINVDVIATKHGDATTPILTNTLDHETRPLSLRWTLYDPHVLELPVLELATARDWPTFLSAIAHFGGPAQNVVYADDQGHIGYHATGRIPLRGAAPNPAAAVAATLPENLTSPVAARSTTQSPTLAAVPDPLTATAVQAPAAPLAPLLSGPISPVPFVPTAAREWSGYIPFDQLPQVFDPADGMIATSNSRTTPDNYPYPITLNWSSPYRNERIWKLLAHRTGLTPGDLLAVQTDVYSDLDHVLAQRLAYAIDHAPTVTQNQLPAARIKTLRQAADLLRGWNGSMFTDSPAAAITSSVHAMLWSLLLNAQLDGNHQPTPFPTGKRLTEINDLYLWGEKDYALEQILMHTPPRWLPAGYTNWDDLLAAATAHALADVKAPSDLATWRYGTTHIVDIEHPIFDRSPALQRLLGLRTGTGAHPLSGDYTTIKQSGLSFGPSERLTVDLGDLDHTTLNLPLGQSGDPASPWFLDQFQAWYRGTTFALPYSDAAVTAAATHTLTLTP